MSLALRHASLPQVCNTSTICISLLLVTYIQTQDMILLSIVILLYFELEIQSLFIVIYHGTSTRHKLDL